MILELDSSTPLQLVKSRFSECYPFLKFEFVRKRNLLKNVPVEGQWLKNLQSVVIIDINKSRLVMDVVKELELLSGLDVHVYRKCSNLWIEIFLTNDWTLEEQNTEGRQISALQ